MLACGLRLADLQMHTFPNSWMAFSEDKGLPLLIKEITYWPTESSQEDVVPVNVTSCKESPS